MTAKDVILSRRSVVQYLINISLIDRCVYNKLIYVYEVYIYVRNVK